MAKLTAQYFSIKLCAFVRPIRRAFEKTCTRTLSVAAYLPTRSDYLRSKSSKTKRYSVFLRAALCELQPSEIGAAGLSFVWSKGKETTGHTFGLGKCQGVVADLQALMGKASEI